ncbi:Probable GTP-binding protein EngB [Buchnera aphidicola (Anoecia corni)]|uniref:Probable GTP-binding protein EngB n=1 Tax=Buchnera aphidicola (Anoecia corni) TaxID=2994477 RepID=A0AAT9IGV3_9GAMM
MNYKYENTKFLTSALKVPLKYLNSWTEIAFFGYSNSGKSSSINALINRKNLARIGKTPGSTKTINFFQVSTNLKLVDFPGYGYSTIQKKIKNKLKLELTKYIKTNKNLKGLINIMDIRHPLKTFDLFFIKKACENNIPVLVLLNKSDKIALNSQKIKILQVKEKLSVKHNNIDIITFSALKKTGIDYLKRKIYYWHQNRRKI